MRNAVGKSVGQLPDSLAGVLHAGAPAHTSGLVPTVNEQPDAAACR